MIFIEHRLTFIKLGIKSVVANLYTVYCIRKWDNFMGYIMPAKKVKMAIRLAVF